MPGEPPFYKIKDVPAFFDAVEAAVAVAHEWKFYGRGSDPSACHVTADYIGDEFDGDGLWFSLMAFDDRPDRVQLTMHARRWSPDNILPTPEVYNIAERLALPLTRGAGNRIGKRLRLCRRREKRYLTGKVGERFRLFCARSKDLWNPGSARAVHPSDIQDFYEFVLVANRCNSGLQEGELRAGLVECGFSVADADELVSQYVCARRILAMSRDEGGFRRGVDVWHPWNAREDRKRYRQRKKRLDAEDYERVWGKPKPLD